MSDTLAERIARVSQKVISKGTSLGSTLSEQEVCAFEKKFGITLPESYRAFLLHIGNGGIGPPHYGMDELGDVSRSMRGEEARVWKMLPQVAEPFPFTMPWIWEADEISDEGTYDDVTRGSIRVGHDGCGMYWHVIVTGPERGNVWWICGEGIQPTSPKRDFLQWYEDWLDGEQEWWR